MIEREKVEQIVDTYFEAFDGTKFSNKQDCLNYEFFLQNKEKILSNFLFFRCDKNNSFQQISIDDLEWFDYCYLIDNKYKEYHIFFKYINERYKDFSDIKKIGFYSRDYSRMFSGAWNGFNGWVYWGTIKELERRNNFKKALDEVLKV